MIDGTPSGTPTAFAVLAWLERLEAVQLNVSNRGCTVRLDPSKHEAWRTAVSQAADDFAMSAAHAARKRLSRYRTRNGAVVLDPSVVAHEDYAGTQASITDAVVLRTGGRCPSTLPPPVLAGSSGFLRGVHLVSGPSQLVRWWRPHPAYFGQDANSTVHPGSLWLQHASVSFDAATANTDASAVHKGSVAMWVLFHVWFTHLPVTRSGEESQSRIARGEVHTLWRVPIVSRTDETLRGIASTLLKSVKRGMLSSPYPRLNSRRPADACSREAQSTGIRWGNATEGDGGGDGGEGEAAIARDTLAALAHAAEAAGAELQPSMPPLVVVSIVHWRLLPRAAWPPQPAARGIARALFALPATTRKSVRKRRRRDAEAMTGGTAAGTGTGTGPLHLHLLDPRAPAVRIHGLGLAEWPFGVRNGHVEPPTPAGTLVVIPSGLSVASAALSNPHAKVAAHWLELTLRPRKEAFCPLPPRWPPLRPATAASPPPAPVRRDGVWDGTALRGTPSTHELFPTPISVMRRSDAKTLADVTAAAAVVRAHAATTPSANVSNVGGWQSRPGFLMDEPALKRLVYPLVHDAIISHLAATFPSSQHQLLASLDIRLSGWANVNRAGDSNALHEHVDQHWALSGVLFLDDGGDDASCPVVFHSPLPPTATYAAQAANYLYVDDGGEQEEGGGDGNGGGDDEGGGDGDGAVDSDERVADAWRVPSAMAVVRPNPGVSVVFPAWLGHWVPPHCGSRTRLSVAFNAAALLPGRQWPSGELSQPVTGLDSRIEERIGRAEVHRLWSLSLITGHVARFKSLAEAWLALAPPSSQPILDSRSPPACSSSTGAVGRCCVAASSLSPTVAPLADCAPCGGGSESYKSSEGVNSAAMAVLLSPIGATVRHALLHLQRNQSRSRSTPFYVVHACVLVAYSGALDTAAADKSIDELTSTEDLAPAAARGIFFPPSSAPSSNSGAPQAHAAATRDMRGLPEGRNGFEYGRCEESRRILLPDVRVAAGDIISHVVYRHEIAKIRAASYRNVDAKEGVVAPDGTVLIWPAWARGVVQHHEYGCERSERALYVRVAPMAMPS